ncbi:MAG: glycosyltransferase [Acidobacteriota bacterium]
MKIGLILQKFVVGGAERVVLELARRFDGSGHDVSIVSLARGGNMLKTFELSGLRVCQLGVPIRSVRSPRWVLDRYRGRQTIGSFFRREHFDVIHTHLMGPDVECIAAARRAQPEALIHTIHNTYAQFKSKRVADRLRNRVRRNAYRRYDRVVAVHDEVRNWAVDSGMADAGHVVTIENGIDFSRLDVPPERGRIRAEHGWEPSTRVLLNVASLTEQKNQINLIRSVARLGASDSNVRLIIAGAGPLESRLMSEIHMLHLEDRVKLAGYRKDVPSLLKSCDLFVLPSRWEGLPMSVIEALAAAIPVVASDIPVHRTVLEDGKLGGLIRSASFEDISNAVGQVLSKLPLAREQALEASSRVRDRFSAARMAREHLALYDRTGAGARVP